MEVAASGGHNVLMIGPPGSGKTMISQRIPTIMPEPVFEEALETTRIYSAVGLVRKNESVFTGRPFRSPHHTVSDAGLIGGGMIPGPERFLWRTTACSFWMSCRNSGKTSWRCSANRWKTAE